jgi:hypothetical protein
MMAIIFWQITSVQLKQFDENPLSPEPPITQIGKPVMNFTNPLTKNNYACNLTHLFGYNNPWPPHFAIVDAGNNWQGGEIFKSPQPGYYNMHDVRLLASAKADDGYYYRHKWPLWPMKDKKELEEFIRLKQVVKIPNHLKWMNRLSLLAWIIFLSAFTIAARKPSLLRLRQ